MFARKDLERDVLSAYQRHSRNLKKANIGSTDPQHPRTVSTEAVATPSSVHSKSPTSEVNSSYTYSKVDTPTEERRSGVRDKQTQEQVEDMDDHADETTAEEA